MLNLIPHADADRPLKVLCLGAHSDDIEIGCGASLLQLAGSDRPVDVHWMVFSGSGLRGDEARTSAERWLGKMQSGRFTSHEFRDGFFPEDWTRIKEECEKLKGEADPDIIFTHYREDLHQDHRVISDLTWNTFRNHFILEYEIPKYDGDMGSPNFYMPVTQEHAREKTDTLLSVFNSQAGKHWFGEELFLGLMRIRGMECCSDSGYAEGFYVRKGVLGTS